MFSLFYRASGSYKNLWGLEVWCLGFIVLWWKTMENICVYMCLPQQNGWFISWFQEMIVECVIICHQTSSDVMISWFPASCRSLHRCHGPHFHPQPRGRGMERPTALDAGGLRRRRCRAAGMDPEETIGKPIGNWWFNGILWDFMGLYGGLMGSNGIYLLVNVYIAVENHHFIVAKSTIYKWAIFYVANSWITRVFFFSTDGEMFLDFWGWRSWLPQLAKQLRACEASMGLALYRIIGWGWMGMGTESLEIVYVDGLPGLVNCHILPWKDPPCY